MPNGSPSTCFPALCHMSVDARRRGPRQGRIVPDPVQMAGDRHAEEKHLASHHPWHRHATSHRQGCRFTGSAILPASACAFSATAAGSASSSPAGPPARRVPPSVPSRGKRSTRGAGRRPKSSTASSAAVGMVANPREAHRAGRDRAALDGAGVPQALQFGWQESTAYAGIPFACRSEFARIIIAR